MIELIELLRQHEGKTLEFKRDLSSPDKVVRTLVAFANGAGAECRGSGTRNRRRRIRHEGREGQ